MDLLIIFLPQSLYGADRLLLDASEYLLPLGKNRTLYDSKFTQRIIGKYGDNRISKIKGHKHSGVDIQGDFGETVYSIGKGTVTHIFRNFPHKTIYIRHNDRKNIVFYSVYIHIEDIQVNVGDPVTKDTPIGRIFNHEELISADFGTPPHLHFEIRHCIDDKGEASFKSMSIQELDKYCLDPLRFFKLINRNQMKGEQHE